MSTTVAGLFQNYKSASKAIDVLKARGFSENDISLLASESSADSNIELEKHTKAPEGSAYGAGIGGAIGAAVAGLTAVGTITATGGIGLIAAGPLVAGLAGAGAGGITGGLIGGLIGMGYPETEAKVIDGGVSKNQVMIGLTVNDDQKDDVKKVFDDCNADRITIH